SSDAGRVQDVTRHVASHDSPRRLPVDVQRPCCRRGPGKGPRPRRARELGLGGHVRFCGFVPDGALPALITGASAFLFPSLYEGFGLPILEAMACGTPVVTSDCSSMPEVAADAAVLVDPARPDAIADGIRRVLADDALRATLKGRGAARARAFPWAATAARTLDVYREAAGAVV
ncbi:MAG TPA: glycosyltransferase family 1 protein, partial [bacterium]|nr:glycosyltransferase family 1 protein [bacterium]